MQVVSYFSALCKKCYNVLKWKVVQPPTRSLDSAYTEHGNPHFRTEHCLNRLSHEYINTTPISYTKCARIEIVAEP